MSFSVECPNCRKSLKAATQHIGKRARCPACGASVLIAEPSPPSPPNVPDVPEFNPSEISTGTTKPKRRSKTVTVPVTAAITVAGLVLGYFAGREHMKYELRSAFADAGEALREGMQEAFSGQSADEAKEEQAEIAEFERQPALSIGTLHKADGFSLALVESRVAPVELEASFGDGTYETDDKYIHFTFRVTNTDDRKILNYRKGNSFGPGYFSLSDDVGNRIRGVSFGISDDPIGTLSVIDDIQPGESRTHLEVFTIPPPKTEHLLLTVDLKSFGGEGRIKYKIPAAQIQGFPVTE